VEFLHYRANVNSKEGTQLCITVSPGKFTGLSSCHPRQGRDKFFYHDKKAPDLLAPFSARKEMVSQPCRLVLDLDQVLSNKDHGNMKTSVDKSICPEWGIVTKPSFRLINRLPTIQL
jgi:hypothetical protein